MTTTYTIKPLAWEHPRLTWFARSIFGDLTITRRGDYFYLWNKHLPTREFTSLEAAQAAAESWYRERLLPALTPSTN